MTAPKQRCSICGRFVAVRISGVLREHFGKPTTKVRHESIGGGFEVSTKTCPGSGRAPVGGGQ